MRIHSWLTTAICDFIVIVRDAMVTAVPAVSSIIETSGCKLCLFGK